MIEYREGELFKPCPILYDTHWTCWSYQSTETFISSFWYENNINISSIFVLLEKNSKLNINVNELLNVNLNILTSKFCCFLHVKNNKILTLNQNKLIKL